MEEKKDYIKKIFDLGKLSFTFAKVNRFVRYDDGIRNESDTDHAYMLSLISCSLADTFYKDNLDIGLVSQFALVHDLVEVYAGDTNTFVNISEESKKEKTEREKMSFQKIKDEFGLEFPYIHKMIERYESQDTKEARFIKLVDKIIPDITESLSNFAYVNSTGLGKDYFFSFMDNKYNVLDSKYGSEFSEILEFYNSIKSFIKEEYIKNYK
jgi:putative hydrolase of HD superfamily